MTRPPAAGSVRRRPAGDRPIRSLARSILAAACAWLAFSGPVSAAPQPHAKARPARSTPAAAGVGKFTAADYVMGAPNAPVTVIEYLSDTCSHCAHFDETVWPQAKAKYVDTGKVKWIVREYLTGPEAISAAGFILARCAGRERYFQVIEQIFKAQEEMFKTSAFKTVFLRIAAANGIDEAKFNACLSDDEAYKALYSRVQAAATGPYKIDGTPTLIIDGKKAFESIPSFGELDAALIAAGAR